MALSLRPERLSSSLRLLLWAVFLVSVLLPAQAQFKVLKAFPESAIEGANPVGRGAVIGNQYFGTTKRGGIHGKGVLYRINLDGTGFAKIKDFTTQEGSPARGEWETSSSLLTEGDSLYGVLNDGEHWGGLLYSIDATGQNFRVLFKFNENLGWDPEAQENIYTSQGSRPALHFIDGNTIYGTCEWATSGHGTIFKINSDGSGFQELVVFQGGADGSSPAQLVADGNVIYGLTESGGIAGKGTIFKINKDGSGFSLIRAMSGEVSLRSISLLNDKLSLVSG
jgi:hypothetical protein